MEIDRDGMHAGTVGAAALHGDLDIGPAGSPRSRPTRCAPR